MTSYRDGGNAKVCTEPHTHPLLDSGKPEEGEVEGIEKTFEMEGRTHGKFLRWE